MFAIAGGLGAMQVAAAKDVKVLGCYSDQPSLAPNNMGTSFEMNLAGMVVTQAAAVAGGSFKGGTEWKPSMQAMWLPTSGGNGDHDPNVVSAEAWAAFQAVWNDLGARKIDAAAWPITMNACRDVLERGSVCVEGLGDDMALKRWFTCMTGLGAVHLPREDAKTAALHGCVENIRSGVTTLVGFMYVHTRPNMTAAVVDAFGETGMRGFVCRGFTTAGQEHDVPAGLIETPGQAVTVARRAIRGINKPGGQVQVGVAPCMIWTVDEAALRLARQLADEDRVLLTTHGAKTRFEIQEAARRYGQTDTEFLSDIGFLELDVLAVHCRPYHIRILRHHDAKVPHDPCSNLYLGSGIAPIPEMPIPEMRWAGVTVGLGHEIGSIEAGKEADLAVVDFETAFTAPIHNPVPAIVYSGLGHEVSSVMIDGRFVLRAGVAVTQDEHALCCRAQLCADALAARAGAVRFKNRGWRSAAI